MCWFKNNFSLWRIRKIKTIEEIILNKMLLAEAIKLEILQLMNCDDFEYLDDLKQTILLLSKD